MSGSGPIQFEKSNPEKNRPDPQHWLDYSMLFLFTVNHAILTNASSVIAKSNTEQGVFLILKSQS
jgi:hypothetical protein